MLKNVAFIGLGSNIEDKLKHLKEAVRYIREDKKCSVECLSSVYETLPYGNKDQENFYNAAVKILTDYELHELLYFLKSVEKKIGRLKTTHWGPREIDLDLLFFNDLIYSDEKLTVPHREIIKRDFVLVPLCEIAPNFIHPELNQKICDICIEGSEKNVISKLSDKIL